IFLTMPLALDLMSALESGWIFPVATTTRARSPRSTSASLEGSISWLGLRAALTPKPPPNKTTRAMLPQIMRRRRFLPFLPLVKPLETLAIQDPRLLRTGTYYLYDRHVRKVPWF